MDIHSWSRPDEVQVRHLELDLDVHFDRKILTGAATLHFDPTSHPELVLDTRDLEIHSVETPPASKWVRATRFWERHYEFA